MGVYTYGRKCLWQALGFPQKPWEVCLGLERTKAEGIDGVAI